MQILCDLDNTLCFTQSNDYENSLPMENRIKKLNKLYDEGHIIRIFTARCMSRCNGDISKVYENIYMLTKDQLNRWGIKHHDLILGKPSNDIIIDDKSVHPDDFFREEGKRGVVIGSFDILHPGYIKMFNEISQNCQHLTVLLHKNPKKKYKIVNSVEDRKAALMSLNVVNEVIIYSTELDLLLLLKQLQIDVRFLGTDYQDKPFTGKELNLPLHYIDRSHGWSTTKIKELIKNGQN
jgi:glycerol-3-phosphate cytidylyltransferase